MTNEKILLARPRPLEPAVLRFVVLVSEHLVAFRDDSDSTDRNRPLIAELSSILSLPV